MMNDVVRSLAAEVFGTGAPSKEKFEEERIQRKQGGHHMPPAADDPPPLDDTDRNTDKIIKPTIQDDRLGKRHDDHLANNSAMVLLVGMSALQSR